MHICQRHAPFDAVESVSYIHDLGSNQTIINREPHTTPQGVSMRYMRYHVLAALFLSLTSLHAEALSVRADSWPPYNYEPGAKPAGFVVDILHQAFGVEGIDYQAAPWNRALEQVREGKIHAVIGASQTDLDQNGMIRGEEMCGMSGTTIVVLAVSVEDRDRGLPCQSAPHMRPRVRANRAGRVRVRTRSPARAPLRRAARGEGPRRASAHVDRVDGCAGPPASEQLLGPTRGVSEFDAAACEPRRARPSSAALRPRSRRKADRDHPGATTPRHQRPGLPRHK